MGILQKLLGADGVNQAKVDSNGSLQVTGATDKTKLGYQSIVCEADAGNVTGTKLNRSPFVCNHNRLMVGLDTVLFDDSFQATAQNTGIWKSAATTLAFTFTAGYVNFNPTASTAAGSLLYQSYRHFTIPGNAGLLIDLTGALTAVPPTNWQMEAGWFDADVVTQPYTPTDGVYFRVNTTGVYGVTNYGGTEQVSALLFAAANIGTSNSTWHIAITEKLVEFWNGSNLLGALSAPSGVGQVCQNPSQPISIRYYNTGVTGAGMSLKMSDITVTLGDIQTAKPWAHQLCGMGLMAYQGQNGQTLGTTALYANSANPTAAVPTNTTAALGSGLGGNFWHTNTLAVNTDGIISSFQNVNGAVGVASRVLYITGVKISTAVQVVLACTGVQIFNWSLAFGHTTVSLAQTEGVAAKAPRRVPLGLQVSIGAQVAGSLLSETIIISFQSPIVVNPGEFIQTVVKNTGTVGTAGQLVHMITFDGYFE